MKTIPMFILICLLSSIFSFNNGPYPAANIQKLVDNVIPGYKSETALQVFNKLKRSLGLTSSDPPYFELVEQLPNNNFVMAMISYDLQKIYLEETAYDLCQSFKADSTNALAVYLAHELAHFHENHEVKNHYVWEFKGDVKDMVFKNIRGSYSEEVKQAVVKALRNSLTSETEKEADLDGGFLAYLAGYKTSGIGEDLLDKTYTIYELNRTPEDYPTFQERVNIVKETETKLNNLVDFFETGNLLIALGEYEDALLYYQQVLKEFQSREIYNNIGVLFVQSFLKEAEPKKIKYAYPVELDLNSRIGARAVSKKDQLRKLLTQAIESFESAISRDQDYPVAQLNRACAHALLANFSKDTLIKDQQFAIARAAVLSARVLAARDDNRWKKTLADTHTLLGIIEAETGDSLKAEKFFDQAIRLLPNNQLAMVNKERHHGKKAVSSMTFGQEVKTEFVDKVDIDRINVDPDSNKVVLKTNDLDVKLYYKTFENSKLLFNYVTEEPNGRSKIRSASFLQTSPDYSGATSKGIRRNDNRKTILETYQAPDAELELSNGKWLVYKNHQIIFQLDTEGKVSRWCVFRHKV